MMRKWFTAILLFLVAGALSAVTVRAEADESVPSDATKLSFDVLTSGRVSAGRDRWFTLVIPAGAAGSYVVVDLEGKTPDIDVDLVLTDWNGGVLHRSVSSYRNERVFARIPENRRVAVRVFIYRPEDAEGTLPAESDFALRAYTLPQPPLGPYAPTLPAAFTDLALDQTVSGMVRGTPAWYRYHIEDTGSLQIAFEGEGLEVALLVEDGSQVFEGTASAAPLLVEGDANTYTDFFLKVTGSGSYRIESRLHASSSGAGTEDAAAPGTGEPLLARSGSLADGDLKYDDGSFYDPFTVTVRAGDRLRISLVSADYDPYLVVTAPSTEQQVNDDRAEGDWNSRIELTSIASGSMEIRASSYSGKVTGDYRLTVERLSEGSGSGDGAEDVSASLPPPVRAAPDTLPAITVLFSGRDAAQWGVTTAPTALSVSARGNPVMAVNGNLFDLAGRKFLAAAGEVGNCAYAPSGALFVVSGRSLGYYAGGEVRTQVRLPENGMKLAATANGLYLFGGDRRSATGLYYIDPAKGYVKILDMPQPIGAASAFGDTLFVAVANDIYRLVPGGEIQLICRLPGPAISSVAAAAAESLFFTAGRALYSWRRGEVRLIVEDIGDLISWHADDLLVLDSRNRNLIRIDRLP
jgi:hypothetical protein